MKAEVDGTPPFSACLSVPAILPAILLNHCKKNLE
jgi:hypothetical protein